MTVRRILSALILTALAGVALGGCGYALVGRSSTLPEDVQRVFIQTLENLTTRQRIDQILTQAISDEFLTRQRFEVARERSTADAVLSGEVTSFRVRPVNFSGGRATEYEILITANMRFVRIDGETVLWQQDRYFFRETYEVEISEANYFDREDLALIEVADKFAETLVIDVLEGF